jgi:cell pole-organizing protein PopZ
MVDRINRELSDQKPHVHASRPVIPPKITNGTLTNTIAANKSSVDIPKLATSFTELPAVWNRVIGPHNRDMKEGRNFTSDMKVKSTSCQIDCLSTVTKCNSNNTMVPMFSNCKFRFYSYGSEARYGCFSTDAIMRTQAEIVFNVCQQYNKCNVSYTPDDLVKTMRKAKGINSKGSKSMTIAATRWGKATFWAMKSGDPAKFEEASAEAIKQVVEQAKAAATDAIAKGESPGPAVQKVIDSASTSFAESVASVASKVAVKKAAYAAYEKAFLDKKKADDAKKQATLYRYASSYSNREGTTFYSYSPSGYVQPTFKLSKSEKEAGKRFAKAIADATANDGKHQNTVDKLKNEKVAKNILKKKQLTGLKLTSK